MAGTCKNLTENYSDGEIPFHNFSPKQKQVIAFGNDSRDIILCDGAIRSGKTISVIVGFLLWILKFQEGKTKDLNFIIAGKTIGSVLRNIVDPMRIVLDWLGINYEHNINRCMITFGRVKIYMFEGFNEKSQDKVQGLTASGCLLDEVALMPQTFVEQCIARCSVNGSKIWMTCNPSNPFHFIKQEYINKAEDKNIFYLHFTMDDNYHLSEKVKNRYKALYVGVFYARYVLGLWKVAEGLIYPQFKDKHIVSTFEREYERYYVSIDYGIYNPMVYLLWGKYKGKWYCIKEYYHSGRETNKPKSDIEYYEDLEKFIGEEKKIKSIIIDPTASSFIMLIRKKRKYKVIFADNNIMRGIANVSSCLDEDLLKFNDCLDRIFDEFYTYAWDDKASERGEDEPKKESDHAMDSMRYFVSTIIVSKSSAKATTGLSK